MDHVFAVGSLHFIVEAQAVGFDQPAESPLDDPSLGQELEALGLIAAANDPQLQSAKGPQGFESCHQLAGRATVSPDAGQPVIEKGTSREQGDRTLAVLDAGWGDLHAKH